MRRSNGVVSLIGWFLMGLSLSALLVAGTSCTKKGPSKMTQWTSKYTNHKYMSPEEYDKYSRRGPGGYGTKVFKYGFREEEKRKRIVVIDSGLHKPFLNAKEMCRDVAYLSDVERVGDYRKSNFHGTTVSTIIMSKMNSTKYCITLVSNISTTNLTYDGLDFTFVNYLDNISIVNITTYNYKYDMQAMRFYRRLSRYRGIKFNVAAGNIDNINTKGLDLGVECYLFPACYTKEVRSENFKVIGALAPYSNVGSVVDVFLQGGPLGYPANSGTSMATALYTGLMAN